MLLCAMGMFMQVNCLVAMLCNTRKNYVACSLWLHSQVVKACKASP